MIVQDEELTAKIALARAGDSSAVKALFDGYAPLIYAQILSWKKSFRGVFSEEELGSVIRELFLRALRSYESGRGCTFGNYAKRCINNGMISLWRRKKPGAEQTFSLEEEGENIPSDLASPEEQLIRAEACRYYLELAKTVLSSYEWRVLQFYIHGYKPSEIAARLRKDEKSVSNALGRIKQKLRAL